MRCNRLGTRSSKRRVLWVEELESRLVPSGSYTIPLDPTLDQFGDQIATIQGYGDASQGVTFGIFDTGASAVTFSADDQAYSFNTPIPVKVAGGAVAGGIGGEITGDVSEPGTILADGIHAMNLTFDQNGYPFFDINLGAGTAITPGIQAFIGTDGSPDLPTITGTPILSPSTNNPNGLAAQIEMQGASLDFSDLIPGLVLTMPDVNFVAPGATPTVTAGATTDPFYVSLDTFGETNYANPGDLITETPSPLDSHVGLINGGVSLADKHFLLDTGAQLTVISPEEATALGFDLNNPETTITVGGVGGEVTVPGFTLPELDLPTTDGGTLQFTNVPIYVLDVAPGIDGLLGMNLFNTAASMVYDPYYSHDPSNPAAGTLGLTFYTDPNRGLSQLDGDTAASLQALGVSFAGALTGHSIPGFNAADTTAPTAGTVNDGSGADIAFQASTTTIAANWSGFSDSGSGIASYQWAIGTSAGGTDIQGFTDVGTATNASASSLSLSNGVTYYVSVKATDNVGNASSVANSDGVTVDTKAPIAGTVNDGSGADIAFQVSTSAITANWSGFSDSGSGIASYQWAIGTSAGGTDVQAFANVGSATNASATSLSLTNGVTYYVSVKATDNVGNVSDAANSDGVTVDTTAPTAGTVNDGLGADIAFQISTSAISANWSGFSDAGSGIASYQWAIGTSAGGTDIQGFTDVGTATNASASSLSLTNGVKYYVSVEAKDNVGNVSSAANSDGVTVDTTAPSAGSVNDGSGADIAFQASTSAISANWSGFSDSGSGIASYQWAIGTTAGGTEIQGFTNVGSATNASASSLSLTNGVKYYVSVEAKDNVGNVSSAANSDGVTVDTTAPSAGSVNDGSGADIAFQISTSAISANWSGFSDAGSGIASYQWAIGTSAGGTEIQGFTNVGSATNASASGLSLSNGVKYYVSVEAKDNVGNVSDAANSDGVTVDTTAPSAGSVNDGSGADIAFQISTSAISANWSGFSDAGSGIASYQWAIGTSAGGTEIQGFTNVGSATNASASGLSLSNGVKYYVSVEAKDNVGNVSDAANSDGVTVDTTAPSAGSVNDGSGADIAFQASTSAITANWSGFSDSGSGIAGYQWAIGTSAGGTQIQAFTDVGSATNASASSLSLTNGVKYYVSVKATDNVGNVSDAANSDGVTVDTTVPTSAVQSLPTFSPGSFTLNWSGSDNGSGLASFSIYVSDNGGDFQPLLSDTTQTSANFTGVNGHTYRFYSVATGNVGNVEEPPANADATTTVDTAAPTSAVGALASFVPGVFAVAWSGGDGSGSSIASYSVFVSDNGGAYTAWQTDTTQKSANFTGVDGHTYAFYSVATDNVGNVETAPANADATTTVDTAAPTSAVGALASFVPGVFAVAWSGGDGSGSSIASYSVFVSDNGGAYTAWQTDTTQKSANFTGVDGHTYAFYSVATDNVGNVETAPANADATTTVDAAAPTSAVGALASFVPGVFAVAWSGGDGSGSGIASYSVFVSDNGGAYNAWQTDTTQTAANFTGVNGHTYAFYSVATDNVGNVEAAPANADASTTVDTVAPTSTVGALPAFTATSNFTVSWSGSDNSGGSGVASYGVFVSDNGGAYTAWQSDTTQTSANFTGQDGHRYAFYSVATDNVGNVQATPADPQATTKIDTALLFSDDFSNGQMSSWQVRSGTFDVVNEAMVGGAGAKPDVATVSGISAVNVAVQADVRVDPSRFASLIARYQANGSYYLGLMQENSVGTKATFRLLKFIAGAGFTQLGAAVTVPSNGAGTLRFEVVDRQLKLFFGPDGAHLSLVRYAYDGALKTAGQVGVRGNANTAFDNFTADAVTLTTPPTPFVDAFTQGDGTQLSRNWTERAGNFGVSNNSLVGIAPGFSVATVNGVMLADASAQANVSLGANQAVGLIARYQTNGSYYLGLMQENSTGTKATFRLLKFIPGAGFTQLGAAVSITSAGTGTLRFEVVDRQLKLFFGPDGDHLSLLRYAYDSSLKQAGLVGVRANAGATLDDFSADAITLTTPSTLPSVAFAQAGGTQLSHEWTERAGNFEVSNNALIGIAPGFSMATVNAVTLASVQADVTLAANQAVGLIARYQTNGSYDLGLMQENSAGTKATFRILRYIPGIGFQQLGAAKTFPCDGVGTLHFDLAGSTLTLSFVGAPSAISINAEDKKITAPGLTGIRASKGAQVEKYQVS